MDNAVAHHDIWSVLGDILLILGLSGLIIPALQRFKISSVIGYLLCGLLLGPYALGSLVGETPILSAFVITNTDLIHTLAELGVVFLMFMIGLELTFTRLWEMRRLVMGLGNIQILVTALVVFVIALQFGNSLATSILVGGAFALSSTAIVMQLLSQWHRIPRSVVKVCFSVLLMQDLAVVPILVLVGAFSGQAEASVMVLLFEAILMAIVVVSAIFVTGKLFLRPLLRSLSPSQNAEWLFAVMLFLVISCAYLTNSFGLSAALGAFLAGLLISETEYRHEIEVITEPVKGLLMGIFFLSVGMAVDVGVIVEHSFWMPVSVVGIFVIKALIFYPLARWFSVPKSDAIQSSILLAQCGEFAFIVIGLALVGGILPADDAQFFLLVATLSLLFSPFISLLAPQAVKLLGGERVTKITEAIPDADEKSNHVIIAGFGRVGQTLAQILEDQNIPYVAIDNNGPQVSRFHSEGYPVIFGNACHTNLWKKLKIDNARAAVITVDDFSVTEEIITNLRREWPLIPIAVRARDAGKLNAYFEMGATTVVPETLESTLQLVYTILETSGVEETEAMEIINKHRQLILAGEEKAA